MTDSDAECVIVSARLRAARGSLRLETSTTGWTRCYLLTEGGDTFLGAEAIDGLIARLIVVLSGGRFPGVTSHPDPPHILGYKPLSCFLLAERHFSICSAYTPDAGGARVLLFLDGHDTSIQIAVPLSAREVVEWRAALAAFYTNVARRLVPLDEADPTTGLWLQPAFLRILDEQLALARQADKPLALLALDVDHLAYVNYVFGPQAGDDALGMVATVLRAYVHQDWLARLGGDEFCALLPGVTHTEALDLAERVRRAAVTINLDGYALGIEAPRRCLSFSLALVSYPEDGEDAATLLRGAEKGVFHAKRQGRDTVYRS
ncbi:MAG: GGDEF domain-containing protein [Chloroflexota bacterium]|nr:GGDEF domain-containing protein [Chloroflexota bacterium]